MQENEGEEGERNKLNLGAPSNVQANPAFSS